QGQSTGDRPSGREPKCWGASIVEDHRTIDLDVKWHGEFDGATLKGRYSTGKKLRTKADRANCLSIGNGLSRERESGEMHEASINGIFDIVLSTTVKPRRRESLDAPSRVLVEYR
ncbi:hypothetical protein THAOC_16405, partial [Thalassiosira oceanica]